MPFLRPVRIGPHTHASSRIGLHDKINEAKWVWVDGTKPAFKNWGSGEPNNSGNEDCAHIRADGKWNDHQCAKATFPSICQVRAGCTQTMLAITAFAKDPMVKADGFVWVPNGKGFNSGGKDNAGRVDFPFSLKKPSRLKFSFEVIAPNGNDDSFYIRVDKSQLLLWHVPQSKTWAWRTFGTTFNLGAGDHILEVHQREDGTKLRTVRAESDQACLGAHAPVPTPDGWVAVALKEDKSRWALSPGKMIERVCTRCVASHRLIVYKRLTDGTGIDFRNLFTSNWFSKPNGKSNTLNKDFALYSSVADAQAGKNAWTSCNYDDPGIGFPRDCGPTGLVGSQWNSVSKGGQKVTWRIQSSGELTGPLCGRVLPL